VFLFASSAPCATNWIVTGWNNLGMHCMDSDYSVFSILPPYNTIHAQITWGENGTAHLITNAAGYSVFYHAVAAPDGSINMSSVDKGNFYQYAPKLLGINLPQDQGVPLPGFLPAASMPGTNNTPRAMNYENTPRWFVAWGIPITPYDDKLYRESYPLMRLTVKNGATTMAATDITLPVSDEMDCKACHASGSGLAAKPAAGWAWEAVPDRDYRLNILRLHDEERMKTMPSQFPVILAARGFNLQGLEASVRTDDKPILCAACHLSEAIPNSGYTGIPPLTEAIHSLHAQVADPANGQILDAAGNRTACYRCHPGSDTRCLRGAMGKAIAPDGSLSMQCQDCHGSLSTVGSTNRTGWLNEPNCQACHTGDAVTNSGQIRYTSVYSTGTVMRTTANQRFATPSNTPLPGTSLFRFSRGHGGLYCEACHGSTHAEFPTAFPNDNITSIQHQGHEGMLSECSVCHGANPPASARGPHGLHPIGQPWVNGHKNYGKQADCLTCHGTDQRGTVLSRSQKDQTMTAFESNTSFTFWRGSQIGCYTCHSGASNTDLNPNQPAVAASRTANTTINTPVAIPLSATDPNGNALTLRIVSQSAHGRVGLSGTTATYIPDTTYSGSDVFTFAAWDGSRDSNLATVNVSVVSGTCSYSLAPASQSFNELGHVGSVHITSASGCPWHAASDYQWITVLNRDGSGSADILYAVNRNLSSNSRTGTLTIANQTITIIQAGTQADTNSDSLPDTWQAQYFGVSSSTNAAPSADPDHDGFSNLDEYLAGTNPMDPNSLLRISSFAQATGSPSFIIGFPSMTDRYYQVQQKTDLLDPQWSAFTNAVRGTGNSLLIQDNTGTNTEHRFYRVIIAY
jgi:hypothetical protein